MTSSKNATSEQSVRLTKILPLLIIAIAALLRLLFLTSKSFWMDEGFSAFMARTDSPTFLLFVRHGEMHIVFYYALLRLWAYASASEWSIRSFSVLVSVVTVIVVYSIGKRLFERNVALIAALLLAVNPTHIAYAQEARSYALETLLVSSSTLFLLRFFQTGLRRDYTAYLCTAVLAVYSHLLALFVPIGQWPVLLVHFRGPRSWRVLIFTVLSSLFLLLPIFLFIFKNGASSPEWLSRPNWHDLLKLFRFLTLEKYGLLYALGWFAALWKILKNVKGAAQRWPVVFVACWLILPILFVVLISTAKPIFLPRYMLICVPAGVLLAAVGFSSLARPASLILASVTVIASLMGVRSYYRHPQSKEDWRSASRYVFSNLQAEDSVSVVPEYGRFTVDYYRQLHPNWPKNFAYISTGDAAMLTGSAERLWLVVYGYEDANHTTAKQTIQSVVRASTGKYCATTSAQFNLIEVWLLEKCVHASPQ